MKESRKECHCATQIGICVAILQYRDSGGMIPAERIRKGAFVTHPTRWFKTGSAKWPVWAKKIAHLSHFKTRRGRQARLSPDLQEGTAAWEGHVPSRGYLGRRHGGHRPLVPHVSICLRVNSTMLAASDFPAREK